MPLLIIFLAGFGYGYFRALRMGGAMLDRLRYGFVYGLALSLAAFIAATLADWWGLLA